MTVALCTLVLNEMEWLEKLYEQHCNWPGLMKWVFVESADRIYAATNPNLVTESGLSTDGTTEWLADLAKEDNRVVHVAAGMSAHTDPAQGKCASRQRYLDVLENVSPDYMIILDADEFYVEEDQYHIVNIMDKYARYDAFVFKHRDIWHPAIIQDQPLFQFEVVGGFWDIPYCRCWRWYKGMTYSVNHNTPYVNGTGLDHNMARIDQMMSDGPHFIHMGFASNPIYRIAKNNYYIARGESVDRKRKWYCDSRSCFESWKPGDVLPRGAKVIPYTGPVPEVFKDVK